MPSKRYKKALEVVDAKKSYPLKSAVEVLTKFPKAKFNETIDLAFRLGVDPKQSDQMVRGTVPLPHGSGKTVRVLVFAKSGAAADAAKAAFTPVQIEENARAVIDAVVKAKPHSVHGHYIRSCTISATMSPPVRVDLKEFAVAV